MNRPLLIKNGLVIVGADVQVQQTDLLIRDGLIAEIGADLAISTDEVERPVVIDATGRIVSPGFIQTHIHLCQTLFRGAADDLELLDWLRERVWPLEAAHQSESLAASARLAVAEMIK